jgi:hypothetical protein
MQFDSYACSFELHLIHVSKKERYLIRRDALRLLRPTLWIPFAHPQLSPKPKGQVFFCLAEAGTMMRIGMTHDIAIHLKEALLIPLADHHRFGDWRGEDVAFKKYQPYAQRQSRAEVV